LLVSGAAMATVGCGLIYSLDIGTGTGKWIGYQILAGVGYGISFQVPIIIGQANSANSDLSLVTSIILCESNHRPPSFQYSCLCSSFPDSRRRIFGCGIPVCLCQHYAWSSTLRCS
jgi:hypothetical protein